MHLVTAQTGDEFKTTQSCLEFSFVDGDSLPLVWGELKPLVQRALDHFGREFDAGSIARQVIAGDLNLWVGSRGAEVLCGLFWRVKFTDRGSKIWLEVIVGRHMDDWLNELIGHLETLKTVTGSYAVEGICRPGLARRLKSCGVRSYGEMMRMV